MNTGCAAFHARLAERALGPAAELAALAADAHVAGCAPCRSALAREASLERLLARVPPPAAPVRLAADVLRGLADARARRHGGASDDDDELDALLERVPAPGAPEGLARRVLGGLAAERAHARPAPPGARARRTRWAVLAAGLAVALGAWAWSRREEAADDAPRAPEAELAALEADAELLAYAAERWELLHDPDLDLWLASLDPTDELLVEYADAGVWTDREASGGGGEAR